MTPHCVPPEHNDQESTKAPDNIITVPLYYRYTSAWNEVNARIGQRQNALNIYVTLCSAIIAILFTAKGKPPMDPRLFGMLIPVASFVFGFLNFKHDRTIGILRSFLTKCEKISYPDDERLIGYNSSIEFRRQADKTRNFHDFAAVVLILVFHTIGLVATHNIHPEPIVSPLSYISIIFSTAAMILSIVLVMKR